MNENFTIDVNNVFENSKVVSVTSEVNEDDTIISIAADNSSEELFF